MKEIDLSSYTEAELVELNHRVVERIRELRQARVRATMTEFKLGDRVSFQPEPGRDIVGTIVRLNRKSVTVATPDGSQWRVAPVLLRREADQPRSSSDLELRLIDLTGDRRRDVGKA